LQTKLPQKCNLKLFLFIVKRDPLLFRGSRKINTTIGSYREIPKDQLWILFNKKYKIKLGKLYKDLSLAVRKAKMLRV
jgi:hypothetical protein